MTDDWNFGWTDECGVHHHYPRLFGWYCDLHHRVCNPYTPVTVVELVDRAGMDPAVSDDVWVPLRQALEGRPVEVGGEP